MPAPNGYEYVAVAYGFNDAEAEAIHNAAIAVYGEAPAYLDILAVITTAANLPGEFGTADKLAAVHRSELA
jgi:hypothetical protein